MTAVTLSAIVSMEDLPILLSQRGRIVSLDRRKYFVQDEMDADNSEDGSDGDNDDESYDSYFDDHPNNLPRHTSESLQVTDYNPSTIVTNTTYTSQVTKGLSSSTTTDYDTSSSNGSINEPTTQSMDLSYNEGIHVGSHETCTVDNNPRPYTPFIVDQLQMIQRTCSEETRSVRNIISIQNSTLLKPTLDPSSSLIILNDDQMKLWTHYQSFNNQPNPCIREQDLQISNHVNPTPGDLDVVVVGQHRRDYSYSGSILTYSEDDTDESIRWNERLVGSRDEGEWSKLLQSVGDINSLYEQTNQKDMIPQGEEFLLSNKRNDRKRDVNDLNHPSNNSGVGFKVYKERWLMLFYMCMLNVLSDWTCYSIAPIALLIGNEFPQIDPQALVTIFLISSSISTLLEPMILARVGLRRTIVFGAFLLMIGNIIKSGFVRMFGIDLQADLSPSRTYIGFFLVGLSQPLYQCTPALLSASWFPDDERTLATGLALNSNQLGIGFAFTFGTLLVDSRNSVLPYFTILSIMSTLVFIGCLYSLQDAPPTPPSKTAARVIRGNWTKLFKKNDDVGEPALPYLNIQRQYSNSRRYNSPHVESQERNRPLSPEISTPPWNEDDDISKIDEGAEPIMIQLGKYLEIDILDDQLLRSIRACFSRAGFIHTLVAFTVSSVVVNVISTYMDYLMRIGGADSLHVGLVGGLFQLVVVVSGILVGKATDQTRAYYSTTIVLLVLGAFALAECGIDLDRGTDLIWSLLITAIFVGPLQPISTELGVDV